MRVNRKDVAAGAIFAGIGIGYAMSSLEFELGTPLRMGPGAFPFLLSGLLVVLGVAIAARGVSMPASSFGVVPWRGLVCVLIAPVLFALTARGLGLVPSIALLVVISSLGNRRVELRFAAALALALGVFCWLIFSVGLGIPLAPLEPWLGF
jgi:hypothetical protein